MMSWSFLECIEAKALAVVVPAHNEELLISRVINTMPPYVDRIIIVNDCSKDRTSHVVRIHPAFASGRVHLIDMPSTKASAGLLPVGTQWVRDNGLDIAVVMAGDAQMDPEDLPALLDPVVDDTVDYSKGKPARHGRSIQEDPSRSIFRERDPLTSHQNCLGILGCG